jgi:uncharacterized membrane protein
MALFNKPQLFLAPLPYQLPLIFLGSEATAHGRELFLGERHAAALLALHSCWGRPGEGWGMLREILVAAVAAAPLIALAACSSPEERRAKVAAIAHEQCSGMGLSGGTPEYAECATRFWEMAAAEDRSNAANRAAAWRNWSDNWNANQRARQQQITVNRGTGW